MPMLDPDDLVDQIVVVLQAMPGVMALLGDDPDNVYAYHLDYSVGSTNSEQGTIEQLVDTIKVSWLGTRTDSYRGGDAIKHDFELSLRPSGRVGPLLKAIRDGVPAIGTNILPFKHYQINSDVDLPEKVALELNSQFIAGGFAIYDFSRMTFTLVERGVDN